jgi:vancomycin resistance protein VanJ
LICCFAFLVWGMEFQFRRVPTVSPSEPGKSLTILTYNRGQHQNQSLQPFKNLTRPDVIALQEAGGLADRYAAAEGYEIFTYTRDEGEFTLLSRYPILNSLPVNAPSLSLPYPSAARFEIDFEGTRIAIYSVHTLSPRDTLLYYRRGAFLYGLIGLPGTPLSTKRQVNQVFWDRRIEEVHALQKIMSEDPLPTLVVGDFNAPSGGYIHRSFCLSFKDAHRASGHGFGYSFPGETHNPLSLGGPWMRIDYLFCDADWEPVWCLTEADRTSQHRAVTAQFRLTEGSP